MPSPLLSVVVPIYNVGSYLAPCLESLVDQSLTDIEIVCVDDGSTDGSGDIADEFARQHPAVRVLHVPNGGLGKARNLGIDAAGGRYLAFVDSDDRVPPRAYELLVESLERSGSDLATGRVQRFTDTRSWSSGLHSRAIPRAARATHISKVPALVYDTTAWNKVFRRDFWDRHELRFPEGVLYEDMPVTIPAHLLAGSVDLLTNVVYEWRERGDGSMSITQRRAELKNLVDRLTALEYVSDFLASYDLPRVQREQDRKVLTLDLPLYLGVLDIADDEYRQFFAEHVRTYLGHVDLSILEGLDPWERVAWELLRRGRVEETVQLVRDRASSRGQFDVHRKGTRLLAELPFLGDAAAGLPDAAYDVTTKLPVRCSVDDAYLRRDTLVLSGFALIDKVPLPHPWSALRYVEFRTGDHRVVRPARPRRRDDATATYGSPTAGYHYAGYQVALPLNRLRAPDTGAATYAVQMKIVAPGGRRGVPLARGTNPLGRTPLVTHARPDGTFVSAYTSVGGELRVATRRDYALVERAELAGSPLRLTGTLRLTRPLPEGASLRWRCGDEGVPPVDGTVTVDRDDPLRVFVETDLGALRLDDGDDGRRVWRAAIETTDPDRSTALVALAGVDLARQAYGTERELALSVGGSGRLVLTDRPAPVRVRSARWDGGRLDVELLWPDGSVAAGAEVSLVQPSSGRAVHPVEVRTQDASTFAGFDVLRLADSWSLPPGTWNLQVATGDPADSTVLPLELDEARCQAGAAGVDQPSAFVRTATQRLSLAVWSNRQADRGPFNQTTLLRHQYADARRRELEDTILFQSWGGKQYSDSPRAIFEELRRQDWQTPMVWVRRDTSVELPPGTRSVIYGSREYFEVLGRARYVVANDAMPTFFEKRTGSRYLQTWHGTPLKRIGFDIENAQFGNRNYLDEFAVEVTKWDQLISPNGFSSEIFRRAFAYDGPVLETGYPRNDIFYSPDAERRRDEVRARLGLHPDQRVILWAPTWREDQRDRSGRYTLPLPFDLATWDKILGPDDVLLFRGHQLVQQTVSGILGGLRQVRNVTMYPDIQELYLAADLMITDYSSVMFDFANTRRPMIFYAWDLEHYRDHLRGFYFDFESTVPGPVVTELADLTDLLADPAPDAAHKERYQQFVDRFCSLEDGRAAQRVISAVFER